MATVPVSQQQVRANVQPTVRQDGSTATNAFGGSVGQAVSSIGDQAYQYAQVAQEKANTTAVLNASNNFNNDTMKTFHDPENGLFNLQGGNALSRPANGDQPAQLGITDRAKQYFADSTKKYSDSLDNDVQKQAFQSYVAGRQNKYVQGAMDHEQQQGEIAYKSAFTANLKTNDQGFVASRNNTAMSDSFLIAGAQSIDIYGRHAGTPVEAIQQSKNAFYTDAIKNGVVASLKEQDIAGAKAVLSRYSDKLDPDTLAVLDGQIKKVELPQKVNAVSDAIFAKYGVENERAGLAEIKKLYGNDPNLKAYTDNYQAKMTDERRFKKDDETKYTKSVARQIDSAGSSVEANNAIDGSDLPLNVKLQLKNMVKSKFKLLAGPKATPEQKFFAKYEKNKLHDDYDLIEEYNDKIASGEEISEKDQKKYNGASKRTTDYDVFSSGGAYNPNPNHATTKKETQSNESELWGAIEKLAESNLPKDDIIAKIQQIAPKYGFDPDYFINGTEWDKLGTVKGQYSK